MTQRITEPTPAEQGWIAGYVEAAGDLAARWVPDAPEHLSVHDLDALWAAWIASGPAAAEATGVVHAVGLAFGQRLVEDLDLRWVVVEDDRGTEMAVQGPDDFLLFPAEVVARHWPQRTTGFLGPLFAQLRSGR
ncbi:DUF3806 domain-containing protein [Pseudonocardia sp. CA-107938]|uniref:DUF3806 domain-containing protein n=1 Tax=Pseudonocardia sp. CA-107938 TaxID=3240021 RepID=UPI003D8C3190